MLALSTAHLPCSAPSLCSRVGSSKADGPAAVAAVALDCALALWFAGGTVFQSELMTAKGSAADELLQVSLACVHGLRCVCRLMCTAGCGLHGCLMHAAQLAVKGRQPAATQQASVQVALFAVGWLWC